MSGNTNGDSLALLPEMEHTNDDVTEGGATSGDVTVPKQVATTSETPSEMVSSGHPVVVKMSDQQEGHLHMGNEVNTTYNHNNPQYNIACEQLVVHSRHFYHQTVNNNNRDNPDRREQDSVADPDSSHSNTFHYIHTDDLQEAEVILEERHLVVLCGPPGSGKTTLGRALLEIYRDKGYQVYIIAHVHELSGFIRGGGRSVVLMDGALGEVRVDKREYRALRSVQQPLQESVRGGNCLLVLTVYPHVLRQLRQLGVRRDMLLLQPACLVEILADPFPEEVKTAMIKFHLQELHLDTPEQDTLVTEILQKDVSGAAFPWCCRQMVKEWQSVADSTVFFAAPAEAHVPFLQHMLRDPEHGETMAVVMSLTMLGLGRFLHDPYRVQTQLEELGFRDSSNYRLEEYSDVLKEFILHKTESSFEGRVWYDAAGLALGRSFSLPILLKVCDAKFLVQHVRTKETATEFSVTIGPSPDDRQLLMQTMYEHMASGRLPELCQHPSLHCPQFLQEFDAFCRANKNHVQRLVSALDTVHRKPLLYWSVWGPTGNLTQWCLKLTEGDVKHIVRGGWLAEVLLACILMRMTTDEKDSIVVALLAKQLTGTYFHDMIHTEIDLPLPSAEQCIPQSLRAAMNQVIADIRINSLCYLGDPSLPIPNKLVSMEVKSSDDADKVHVVVPSKQWYLVLRLLADRQVDERDEEGNTLLHVAADTGDLDAVKIAVKSGASLTARNNKGQNPPQLAANRKKRDKKKTWTSYDCINGLHKACRSGDQNTVKVLLCSSVSVNDMDMIGRTPLHVACETGETDIATLLISLDAGVSVKDNGGFTPLHDACKNGTTQTALLLIQHHAHVNVKNNDGWTPLHYACLCGNTQTALLLIQLHADVNVKDNDGNALLHYACSDGNTQTAVLLIQHHADVNVKDNDGYTPLHYACSDGNTQTALLLIHHHADVNVKTKIGKTPLDVALYSQDADFARLLIQHGATVKRNSETHKGLISYGINVFNVSHA
ncbi:hypothetical protein BaRGS_00018986 [Batillaria attramentaria]|uniref:Novel STAND NTPase 3 domain-containing protein n=1 Tax=Batillaria attramentaria TaxID=370345 RepID=A0ABD0KSE4_9CAEN